MDSLTTVTDDIIEFHAQLCRDWEHAGDRLVDPGMTLYVPEAFPWQPVSFRGITALQNFRDALHVISDGTFEVTPDGHTADERLVAVRCRESATRNNRSLEWSSLWTYVLAGGQISEARVVHSVASDDLADFWCT
jgi:ketosteroid isomerase-like protein